MGGGKGEDESLGKKDQTILSVKRYILARRTFFDRKDISRKRPFKR